jgi:hypothetical protein
MTPLRSRSPYENYPPGWSVFTSGVRIFGAEAFGFVMPVGEVNRFAARYRAAKCFREVVFDGVTVDTGDGYTALCQILLIYSAFEHLLRCLGIEQINTEALLNHSELGRVLQHLRRLNGHRELFATIRPYLNPQHQRQVDDFIQGRRCNPFYLASGIRHAFAHGKLTATPVNAPPRSVATVSRYLSRVLMKVMDREFERRMTEFLAGLEPA